MRGKKKPNTEDTQVYPAVARELAKVDLDTFLADWLVPIEEDVFLLSGGIGNDRLSDTEIAECIARKHRRRFTLEDLDIQRREIDLKARKAHLR